MADNLKTYFATTMRADTTMRSLVAEKTSPYGIYYQFPLKKDLKAPVVTFKTLGGTRPAQIRQDIVIGITAWGNNFSDLQDQIYKLFHNTSPVVSGYRILAIKWAGSGPELWDEKLQCFYREDRYQIIRAKD